MEIVQKASIFNRIDNKVILSYPNHMMDNIKMMSMKSIFPISMVLGLVLLLIWVPFTSFNLSTSNVQLLQEDMVANDYLCSNEFSQQDIIDFNLLFNLNSNIASTNENNSFSIPSLTSTFLGGINQDYCIKIVKDQFEDIYIAGNTESSDFPSMFSIGQLGSIDCFVIKLDSTMTEVKYSLILGGSGHDQVQSIEVDTSGNVYIAGTTSSINFPTENAYQSDIGSLAYDGFITKINATGNGLIFSTYIGGHNDDGIADIILGPSNEVDAVGVTYSDNFPILNPFDSDFGGFFEGFILRLNSAGNCLDFSSFIGGSSDEIVWDIASDSLGNIYATGHTFSADFPIVNAIDESFNGNIDCFVVKVSSDNNLQFSTFVGGEGNDFGRGIGIDSTGRILVAGFTDSNDFPLVDSIDDTLDGETDCFLFKIDSDCDSLLLSTYIGGAGLDQPRGLVIDEYDSAIIVGETNSTDFPCVNAYSESFSGGEYDGFILNVNNASNQISFSTYIGGSNLDSIASVTIGSNFTIITCGSTWSADFFNSSIPSNSFNGEEDGFLVRVLDPSDSDGDLIPDWWEHKYGLHMFLDDATSDIDGDTLTNLQEYEIGTNPLLFDSDDDSYSDGWEVQNGFNPLNPVIPFDEALLYNRPLFILIVGVVVLSIVTLYILDLQIEEDLSRARERAIELDTRTALDDLKAESGTK